MLLHVAITNSRKDARSLLSAFRRVFTNPTPTMDSVANNPFGCRAYCLKKPSSFKSLQKGHHGEQVSTGINVDTREDECDTDVGASSHSRNDTSTRYSALDINNGGTLCSTSISSPHDAPPILPTTKWELYQEILRLISLTPPAPFSYLLRVHQRQPTLQSVESYNLLLQLSIRHTSTRHTQLLIRSMTLNQIKPNTNTEKLAVRYLVMSGKWKQAWQQTVTRYPSLSEIPMAVLIELLAPGTRSNSRTLRPSYSRVGLRSPLYCKNVGNVATKIPLDTLIFILNRFPRLPLDELARLPLRVISYAVRGLIRNGHDGEAILLTENHLKTLRPGANPRRIDFARDLVHLHLSSGEVKLANYRKKRRLIERLLSLHPKLTPNSKTVFLLMRYMKRSKRCGIEAYLFYKDYCARWGTAVQSQEVRRRIIAYAIKQRKLGIAKEISLEVSLDESSPCQMAVRGAGDSLWRVRAWRTMYPRKGFRSRLWRRLLIRLLGRRRAQKRRLSRLKMKSSAVVK